MADPHVATAHSLPPEPKNVDLSASAFLRWFTWLNWLNLPEEWEQWVLNMIREGNLWTISLLTVCLGLTVAVLVHVVLSKLFLRDTNNSITETSGEVKMEKDSKDEVDHRSQKQVARAKQTAVAAASGAPLPSVPTGHPNVSHVDPVAAFEANETDDVPFQCPFMEAFKMARQRNYEIIQEAAEIQKRDNIPDLEPRPPLHSSGVEPGDFTVPTGPPTELEMKMARALVNTEESESTESELPLSDETDQVEEMCRQAQGMCPEEAAEFYEHIPGFVKEVAQEKLMSRLSDSDREAEIQAREEQMKCIYELMREQDTSCGLSTMDDIQEQMRLYVK